MMRVEYRRQYRLGKLSALVLPLGSLFLEQRVGNVMLVEVGDIHRGFFPNPQASDDFNVVKPDVGIQSAPFPF